MDIYTVRNKLNIGVPITEIPLRVTYYSRVSTDHLEQKKSLQNQKEHFDEYIKQNKNWTYIKGYVDDGFSGTSDIKRDSFMRMIEDASLNKFDLIITKEISRFSRNTLDSIKYTRLLLSYGVFVLFINDNINTALPDSELRLTIMASMAQDEIRRLSQRVKFGMNRAILRGEILGNNMLYGYKKDKSTKSLKVIKEEANIIKKIYELYTIDNLSLSKISNYLNKKNITTREGNKWSTTSISRIIKNPKYKGYYCGRKTEIIDYMTKKVKYIDKNNWITYKDTKRIPLIVDEYLWNKANDKLNKTTNTKFPVKKELYLYSNKLYCKNHNQKFTRRIFRRNNKDISWVCSMYLKNGKNYCNTPNIRESELNTILNSIIKKLNINKKDILTLLINQYKKNKDININNIEKYLNNIIDSNQLTEKIINIILDKIIVSKKENTIILKIYFKLKNKNKFIKEYYTFKRGIDTKCTKRYTINYEVEYFL